MIANNDREGNANIPSLIVQQTANGGFINSNSMMEIDDSSSTVFSSSFSYSDSDTSLHYIQNETELICCVNGPGELPMAKRINDRLAVSVLYYMENGASTSSNELQEFANLMIDRSSHPRAGLSINVLQMRDNGSRISAALNAVSLALLDSAILFDILFAAAEVALLSDNSIVVNPTKDVEEKAVATALLIFSSIDKELKVCGFRSRGIITSDFYCGAVEAAKSAATE
uniref:Exoribonuclease phosphorolytic domain-containing protein n=1 Tax=Panagrolaimus sp. ES5 TaxID=591445 RepID=A0AC34G403_9BILA